LGAGEVAPLECIVHVSEGRSASRIEAVALAAGRCLLDVHTDPFHNRSVLTIAGADVQRSAQAVAATGVSLLDLNDQADADPRLGVIDVVAFVPIPTGPSGRDLSMARERTDLSAARAARDGFAAYASNELGVPCFLYGPERPLAEVRRRAFREWKPDTGPQAPHPMAGAICVGARDVVVAYNLWLALGDLDIAQSIARAMRGTNVRAVGLEVGGRAQVSCNLVEPFLFGPTEAFDFVSQRAPVARAELIGLVPAMLLEEIPADRWPELDLGEERTIEARLAERAHRL